jgi:WD40 repeat protein
VSLETDGQTRREPANRVVWFEAEDRVVQEVRNMVGAEVADVQRAPQDAIEDRPTYFFITYALADAALKGILLGKLSSLLHVSSARVELWPEGEVPATENWEERIQTVVKACDFGILLGSPEFFGNPFITKERLTQLLKEKLVLPVALKRLLVDGSMNLKGLGAPQFFFDRGGKSFAERATDSARDDFVLQLYQQISSRLAEGAGGEVLATQRQPGFEVHLRTFVGEFDEERFVHTEGVAATMSKGLESAPEIDARQRADALVFLDEWLREGKQPYCALLGEYGMGKTTTCKALAKELLERRDKGEEVLLPIYLDLRYVGESARRDLELEEILELILKHSWKSGPGHTRLTARELIALVESEGALVIWDGLDEVLVHLETHAGQMFTRQLFRILPPTEKGRPSKGKLLISCRTHYFRTLRDQQTHFRAEDRDNLRADDYRAPFVLLPFTPEQIKQYVKNTLPDENPDRVMEALGAVHNLKEMAERPYTLSLIAEQFAQIEQWKAEGRRVTGLTLYRHMVRSWLERDTGKHQLTPDHKQALMEHFAAALWRSGERFWSVENLEQWLIDFLEARPGLAAHYQTKGRELLKEDLRTATFLVREGDDRFRFAHTSLQEFFLSGYLRRALVEGNPEAWDLPPASPETLDFLGQWLEDGRDQPSAAAPMRTLGALRDGYRSRASELAFSYFLLAHRRRYPAPSAAGFQLPGANLTRWEIAGEASPLVLDGANFKGAKLWNSRWLNCNLGRATFDGADGYRAEFLQCHMTESGWRQAKLEATRFRDCALAKAVFNEAACTQTQFLRCDTATAQGLPDGRPQAVYALGDGIAVAREVVTTGQAPRVMPASGHYEAVLSCAWSPDGSRIVSASRDKTLRIWDGFTGACLGTLVGHSGSVNSCAWSPDGRSIVSASDDRTLRIWDARSGTLTKTLSGHENNVSRCAWSRDGKRIVSASLDGTLRIWEIDSEAPAVAMHAPLGLESCDWSPDGNRIVAGSSHGTLVIKDAFSGDERATMTGHEGAAWGCSWSNQGDRIASSSMDKTLRIWDAASGAALMVLDEHEGAVSSCVWSNDDSRIASCSLDKTLRVWDARTGELLVNCTGLHAMRCCAWSPDNRRLVSASDEGKLVAWDSDTGEALGDFGGRTDSVLACSWSPDASCIVSATDENALHFWDVSCDALAAVTRRHTAARGCVWSPDGSLVLSACSDHTVRLSRARSGETLGVFVGHQEAVNGCAWSPDGGRFVSASDDRTMRLWDVQSRAMLTVFVGHQDLILGCSWSPDGTSIVSASKDNTVRTWDARSGQARITLFGHNNPVSSCAWSPNGEQIVSASYDKTLRIWSCHSGEVKAILAGHTSYVLGCAWSPDGTRLISASADKTLRIWNSHSGRVLATLVGHEGGVTSCAWSKDGSRVVSASADGTLRLWNALNYVEVAALYTFKTPDGQGTWAAIDHPNNKILACGEEAWRCLGWVVRDPDRGLEWLPAETFGPLPVHR